MFNGYAATTNPTVTLNRSKRYEPPYNMQLYCDRFINPITDNNTFFSPFDPTAMVETYPPKADCTFVLEGMELTIYNYNVSVQIFCFQHSCKMNFVRLGAIAFVCGKEFIVCKSISGRILVKY